MNKCIHTIITLCLELLCISTKAQNNYYNSNSNSGLPSNHVYYIMADRSGYLWMATPKGVVRCNGYECRVFDHSDGISNEDTWYLYEDRKQRIWLSTISDEIGYIRNNTYHTVYCNSDALNFYPRHFQDHDSGIVFVTNNKNWNNTICIEKRDTLNAVNFGVSTSSFFIDRQLRLIMWSKDGIYVLRFRDGKIHWEKKSSRPHTAAHLVNNWLLPAAYIQSSPQDSMLLTRLDHFREQRLQFPVGEKYVVSYPRGTQLYLSTDKAFYLLDSNLQLLRRIPFSSFSHAGHTEARGISMLEDKLWGRVISTDKNGVYFSQPTCPFKARPSFPAEEQVLPGIPANKAQIAWNKKTTDYQADTSVTITGKGMRYSYRPAGPKHRTIVPAKDNPDNYLNTAKASIVARDGFIYTINKGEGLFRHRISGHRLHTQVIDSGRFYGLLYDSLYEVTLAYDYNSLLLFKDDKKIRISKEVLQGYGISRIEKVIFRPADNILLIKTDKQVLSYDLPGIRFRDLYDGTNLKDAKTELKGNLLVVAGKAGVSFRRIYQGHFSAPLVYPNHRLACYTYLYDMALTADSLLLNTDNGALSLALPDSTDFDRQQANIPGRRLMLVYKGVTRKARPGDTLRISQGDLSIGFDVINPYAVGKLHFRYRIGTADTPWQELNGNTLSLRDLVAGKEYTLSVQPYDEVWVGRPRQLQLYIIPYHWQTGGGIRELWIAGIMAALVLSATVLYITRRHIIRKQAQQQRLLELELKSIYAQINPHFIYNTLGTGLYFINEQKNREAYDHFASFSSLLRSYLHSSRNKFISLAEELQNLEQYIGLQLARFEDKFRYLVHIDPAMDPAQTFIPALLLQPLVENAINHGLMHKQEGGLLSLSFRKDSSGAVLCIIDDNGIGRKRARQLNAASVLDKTSYGDELIRELISLFNSMKGIKISLSYIDKEAPDTGTTVIITIKQTVYE